MQILPPHPSTRTRVVMDIECYVDYFLVKFATLDTPRKYYEFEMYPPYSIDTSGIQSLLMTTTIVTFNGNGYDAPMLAAALQGFDCQQLKWLSDQIIVQGLRPWDIERQFNIFIPTYFDHIDLIEVMPGQHGLKMYMAKMHSRKIQELPIEPSASISPGDRLRLREYCANDLEGTIDALRKFEKEIKLREKMTVQYGIDLRSKSDAQIAEAVIKHELGFKVERPVWAVGTAFHYEPPAYVQFQTDMLCQLLDMVRRARFVLGIKGVEMPPELDSAKIKIGSSTYRLGLGGLHSSESSVYHIADTSCDIVDIDVESYYPKLMLNSGAYPPQMGPAFIPVFRSIVERRVIAKATVGGIKKKWHAHEREMPVSIVVELSDATAETDSLKIVVNGTFGKTLAVYGILSAPKMGIQTTVTGQLSILMLIEMLELCGIAVVSANTDGIITKCPRSSTWLRNQIVTDWETRTGLKTERTEYLAVYSRDVNNYVAVKTDRSVKLKGAYAPPVPVGGSWPNPTGEVCVDALVAYLLNGTPLEQTIQACTDVRKFVYVRNVKGGGQMLYAPEIEAASTVKGKREQLAAAGYVETSKGVFVLGTNASLELKDAHAHAVARLRAANPVRKEYLGKVVRWYYARGSIGTINYVGSGNKVPRTEGCRPLMELPDTVPGDIDYAWYVTEAKSLLTDLGVAIV